MNIHISDLFFNSDHQHNSINGYYNLQEEAEEFARTINALLGCNEVSASDLIEDFNERL